ncbi:MAG: YkgJ family cysteine cluster protein [Proteobacteria bacterium]|nr:YkgJ family cysteine cluster protein [Pseudomonadota bacterium]
MSDVDPVFNCQQCGWCCRGEGGIALDEKRVGRLASYLGLPVERLLARFCHRRDGQWYVAAGRDGYCLFFDHSIPGCAVHPVKPEICELWPYFPGNVANREGFEVAKNNCPGIGRDVTHEAFVANARHHGLGPKTTKE